MYLKKCDIISSVLNGKLFFLSLIFLLAGCWGSSTTQSKLVVINVLDADYFQDCHMTGSINIPFEQFETNMKNLRKTDRYVLYCSNYACTAAPFAAEMLQKAGFNDVSVFPGGIVEWYQQGYPCTGSCLKEYLKEENDPMLDDDHGAVKVISADDLKEQLGQK